MPRTDRITIDILDNGFLIYTYCWNESKGEWEEAVIKCCQDRVVLADVLTEYFDSKVGV